MVTGSRKQELLDGLRQEETRLGEVVGDFERQAQGVRQELEEIKAAIAALSGAKKPPRKRGKTGGGAGASTEEVIGHVRAVLQHATKGLAADALRDQVGQAVAAKGKSRAGLHLSLRRALKDEQFVEDNGTWQLAAK